jgi:hypothetical protein
MSSELEHPVVVLVALDELEVTVEEPEDRIEELELSVGEAEVPDVDAEIVEDEPGVSAAATVPGVGVDFE